MPSKRPRSRRLVVLFWVVVVFGFSRARRQRRPARETCARTREKHGDYVSAAASNSCDDDVPVLVSLGWLVGWAVCFVCVCQCVCDRTVAAGGAEARTRTGGFAFDQVVLLCRLISSSSSPWEGRKRKAEMKALRMMASSAAII